MVLSVEHMERIMGKIAAPPETHAWFVTHEVLGYPNVKVYDGSMREYPNRFDTPMKPGVVDREVVVDGKISPFLLPSLPSSP